MYLLRLAFRSLLNRRFSALLTVLAIALSVTLLLGVEKIRTEARASFASTISGTDLIVGPRTGSVQLLLYSVFRIGNASSNMHWDSFQKIAAHPRVDWAIPISLGDSHRGFKVMGTTGDYFTHYRHGRDRQLVFSGGEAFADLYDAVIGADIARELNYQLGSELVLAHLGLNRAGLERQPVTELSIGQQQRVAAARALIGSPELVIADEPTSALDADTREAFLQLLLVECQAAGSSLLFVSHDAALESLFDRSLSLRELNRAAPAQEVI